MFTWGKQAIMMAYYSNCTDSLSTIWQTHKDAIVGATKQIYSESGYSISDSTIDSVDINEELMASAEHIAAHGKYIRAVITHCLSLLDECAMYDTNCEMSERELLSVVESINHIVEMAAFTASQHNNDNNAPDIFDVHQFITQNAVMPVVGNRNINTYGLKRHDFNMIIARALRCCDSLMKARTQP